MSLVIETSEGISMDADKFTIRVGKRTFIITQSDSGLLGNSGIQVRKDSNGPINQVLRNSQTVEIG